MSPDKPGLDAEDTPHRHPMAAHLYDQMAGQGMDMSGWERVAPPPGQPQFIVRHYTNRAERRAKNRQKKHGV